MYAVGKKMKKNYGMNESHTNSCYIGAYMYVYCIVTNTVGRDISGLLNNYVLS